MTPHSRPSLRSWPRLLVALLGAALVASFIVATTTTPANAARTYKVTAKANVSTLTLGSTGVIRGTVRPAAPKQRVFLQQLVRGDWTTVRAKRLTKKSKYKLVMNPTRAGVNQFRVCKKAYKKIRAACTGPVRVSVYRWHYLTDFDSVSSYGIYERDPLSINGVSYKKSLVSSYNSGTKFIEYNLDRKCPAFKAVAGIGDESETGATGQVEILADGTSKMRQTYALGQSAAIALDVTNTLRLRIETTSAANGIDEYIGVGSPQVYCAF